MPKNVLILKDPQFHLNLADIQAMLHIHELIILTKFHNERAKIVIFFYHQQIVSNFFASVSIIPDMVLLTSSFIQSTLLFQPLHLSVLLVYVQHTSSFFHIHSYRCLVRPLLKLECLGEAGIPSKFKKYEVF